MVDSEYAEVSPLEENLLESSKPLQAAAYLHVEVTESFNTSAHESNWLHLERLSANAYSAKSNDYARVSACLARLPEVYAVTPLSKPQLHNIR
jgi:hypothetical protein